MSALARAGNLADRVTFYRHDLAYAEDPGIGTNPHGYSLRVADPISLASEIAHAALTGLLRDEEKRSFNPSRRVSSKYRSCCRYRRVSISSSYDNHQLSS
jgi:hypothetical protein